MAQTTATVIDLAAFRRRRAAATAPVSQVSRPATMAVAMPMPMMLWCPVWVMVAMPAAR
ncbi:hypothetical protein [Rhodospirillum rubrum]|uniref:hypothetical protein n=1 Tax=Rhodospirillum rubrum TaxID=1085 RepID=UPI00003C297F|nr:hypothetical protein [Rhodospirillum rubrum]AEO49149.1 hypothetical protein F11_13435 [Rhodospirillum rubrum F11]QXG79383.1 hypothetical protein KUL73_13490 [Rhodospirillum rubrum]